MPKRTLMVGGGYIACETANFLAEFGSEVDLCARSIFLRGFDMDCVNFVLEKMLLRAENLS